MVLENKKIKIMGPAPRKKQGFEPQNNEVYAYMTFRGRNKRPEQDRRLPSDISYYNAQITKTLFNEKQYFIDELKFLVFKDRNTEPQCGGLAQKSRFAFPLAFGCGFGFPYLLPIMLFDLLHYNVKAIDVLYCNMFYSNNPYDKEYDDSFQSGFNNENQITMRKSFAIHDMIGNWNLLRSWWHDGLFRCDDELQKILEMNVQQYAYGLECIYRTSGA